MSYALFKDGKIDSGKFETLRDAFTFAVNWGAAYPTITEIKLYDGYTIEEAKE